MGLAEELQHLDQLRARGVLTDDEFQRAKARVLQGEGAGSGGSLPAFQAINRLRRSRSDRWVGGVCGGLAAATGLQAWAWRCMFALLLLIGGSGVLFYLLLWIFVPDE